MQVNTAYSLDVATLSIPYVFPESMDQQKIMIFLKSMFHNDVQELYPDVQLSVTAQYIEMSGPAGQVEDAGRYMYSCLKNLSLRHLNITLIEGMMMNRLDV